MEDVKDVLRTKTAAQIIAETRGIIQSLDVPPDSIDRLLQNRNYTPTDLLIMSRALASIGAQNTAAFVDSAAIEGASRDIAFYERQLAVLMAARNTALGGIAAFVQPHPDSQSPCAATAPRSRFFRWTISPGPKFRAARLRRRRQS